MLSISELADRYSVAKNQIQIRKRSLLEKGLEIPIVTENREGHVKDNFIPIFDAQDKWIKDGNSIKTFQLPITPEVVNDLPNHNTVENTLQNQPEIRIATESIKEIAIAVAQVLRSKDPLEKYEKFRWLARFEIEITTSELRGLIGIRPRGEKISRGNFIFFNVGKIGRENAWRIVDKNILVSESESVSVKPN